MMFQLYMVIHSFDTHFRNTWYELVLCVLSIEYLVESLMEKTNPLAQGVGRWNTLTPVLQV